MSDPRRLGRMGRRLAGAILLVSASSLAVLFVGTVVPHLVADPPHPDDAVSPPWLLAASAVALVTAAILWMATTLNSLQITVARIDERQRQDTTRADIVDLQKRHSDLQGRVTILEQERKGR